MRSAVVLLSRTECSVVDTSVVSTRLVDSGLTAAAMNMTFRGATHRAGGPSAINPKPWARPTSPGAWDGTVMLAMTKQALCRTKIAATTCDG